MDYFQKGNDKFKLYILAGCGVFIVLFLGIFRPFEMSNIGFVHLLGYGLITFCCCFFYYVLIPRLYPKIALIIEDSIYIKQIPYDLLNIISIGCCNFFFSVYVDKTSKLTWEWFFRYQFYTLAIGSMLSFVLYFVIRSYVLKERLSEVEKLNEILEHKIAKANELQTLVFESETRNEKVVVQTNDLICVKAEGNYSQFHYVMNGIVQTKLLRMSLKNAETIIGGNSIFSRSHRSYIVNIDKVSKIKPVGNSYQIWVEGLTEPLPASRQNISDLKASIIS